VRLGGAFKLASHEVFMFVFGRRIDSHRKNLRLRQAGFETVPTLQLVPHRAEISMRAR
jgi:hypothetical protein